MDKLNLKGKITFIIVCFVAIILTYVTLIQENLIVPIIHFSGLVLSLLGALVLVGGLKNIEQDVMSIFIKSSYFEAVKEHLHKCAIFSFVVISLPTTLIALFLSWQISLALLGIWSVIIILVSISEIRAFERWEKPLTIILGIIILLAFSTLNFYTYQYKVGIGAIPVLIGKWQGKICYMTGCVEKATAPVTYRGPFGGGQTIYFCDEHINDRPKSIGSYGYSLTVLVFSGGTIAAYIFLIISIGNWIKKEEYDTREKLLYLTLSTVIAYIVPTVGAYV